MTLEDIQQALRLTAMGRVGHPLQVELAEGLARLLAPAPVEVVEPDSLQAVAVAPVPADAPKKRAKKAD